MVSERRFVYENLPIPWHEDPCSRFPIFWMSLSEKTCKFLIIKRIKGVLSTENLATNLGHVCAGEDASFKLTLRTSGVLGGAQGGVPLNILIN
jgi:hypothetical protein